MRRMCYVCNERPARRLETRRIPYEHAAREPVVCSYKCAADFGLLALGAFDDYSPLWCPTHGWTDRGVQCCDDDNRQGTDDEQ